MKSLIVYASKYGCTEKCAGLVNSLLKEPADVINLKDTKETDLSSYEKVIIGGSVYMGKIRKEVTEFCSKYQDQLAGKRVGLFICGMVDGDAIQNEINTNFPACLLKTAVVKEYLGGEFLLDKMNVMERMVIKKVSKVTSNQSKILEEKIQVFAQAMNQA